MKPVIEIDFDDALPRENYRVTLHQDDPVSLTVAGVAVDVIDISAKGVAFRYQGQANKDSYPVVLTFETDKVYVVECDLKIIRRHHPEYSAEFVHIAEKDIARIARLIIECQKRDIRRSKHPKSGDNEITEG
ncbi:PilZ domain-containing protein [Neptunomonas antarctica]|uniref:PilZ domain-containing protein n=1 Tax=Neptunomonas antarctica TaxID=619304 RepID=A0A1N7MUP2_9GAMM|nr:PilZ domain-containing protein [Neptunomonas antarctica]SIS89772.1 PilZ domain-containing protein [Neptunomonas antarctica]